MKQTRLLLTALCLSLMASCAEEDGREGERIRDTKVEAVTGNAELLSVSSVTLSGLVRGDYGIAGFCYSSTEQDPTPDNANVAESTDFDADKTFRATLTGLRASTTYYYRAFATKAREPMLAAEVRSFTTEAFTPNAIDLFLPSRVKWADCNLGAYTPEQYGDYYAWGDTVPMTWFSEHSYQGGCYDEDMDAARWQLGGNWRMPTDDEMYELRSKCKWTWTQRNGVNGYEVKGVTGSSIFLPSTGYRDGYDPLRDEFYGVYWTRSISEPNSDGNHADVLFFQPGEKGVSSSYSSSVNIYDWPFYRGCTIRPVCP